MKIEFDEQCPSCGGTGLYIGMAERDGAAVMCHVCKGTGKHHFVREYEEFTGRKTNPKVIRVYQVNPGIMIGSDINMKLEDFGGMSLEDWEAGKAFSVGTEDRNHTCPAWWYQSADYTKKPNWDECGAFGSFSDCKFFCEKSHCWIRFDRENP